MLNGAKRSPSFYLSFDSKQILSDFPFRSKTSLRTNFEDLYLVVKSRKHSLKLLSFRLGLI